MEWYGKPYYSLDAWCRNTYGCKCYKIALDAHMSCPNRDGTLGNRGCIFCSEGGSGDFAISLPFSVADIMSDKVVVTPEIMETCIREGRDRLHNKDQGGLLIPYFQAYTNTYAPVKYLEAIYSAALQVPDVAGIAIGTRPDCLGPEVLELLALLRRQNPDRFIWIELGLQTIHEQTATYIRRGYGLDCFTQAFKALNAIDIPVIVHLILGLPGETVGQMMESVDYVASLHPFGVKLQLLHVLEGTDLARCYKAGDFEVMSMEEYLSLVQTCVSHLPEDIVIHRITGDGAGSDLIAPLWSRNKKNVLNTLHAEMKRNNIRQGRLEPDI